VKSVAVHSVPAGRTEQGPVAGATAAATTVLPGPDGARGEVIRRLLIDGPSTASHLAAAIGVSGTAVRRQLDALVADGSVTTRRETVRGTRGRGRPARVYLLTDLGRRRLPHAYDELAEQALDYLEAHGGAQAVAEFARERANKIVDGVRGELAAAQTVGDRARILARALSRSGFVANVESVPVGEQLSQHHCPVAHVAGKYPQLCEQELAVFTEALGTYAQRLATIARGDSFCTTFIPPTAPHSVAPPAHGSGARTHGAPIHSTASDSTVSNGRTA
jgi:predicted ArsR family transcriptional regulator